MICGWCQAPFTRRGRQMYCGPLCGRLAREDRTRRQWPQRICEWCQAPFAPHSSETQRFCGTSCSAKWRNRQPWRAEGFRRMYEAGQEAHRGVKNPAASERMKCANPMSDPAAVAKMAAALRGRTWLSARGGRGVITEPQQALAGLLGLPVEHIIPTGPVAGRFPSLPPWYAVDLADPASKTAIEVDGNSHRSRRWRYLDRRKTEVLEALGWSVLRYWNEDVLAGPERVAAEIRAAIERRRPASKPA